MSDLTLELLKQDLKWQLSFEELDWDYFLETAQRAKEIAEQCLQQSDDITTPDQKESTG